MYGSHFVYELSSLFAMVIYFLLLIMTGTCWQGHPWPDH